MTTNNSLFSFQEISGSGEDIEENVYRYNRWVICLAFSPLLLTAFALCMVLFYNILDKISLNIKDKISLNIKDKISLNIKDKIKTYYYNCKNPTPIINGKLSKHFMKQLNSKNSEKNSEIVECSICLEIIKSCEKKVLYLNCSHKFHRKCLQGWIKSQTSVYINPTCPLDRSVIIEIPKTIYNSDSDSGISYNSDYD
jgi:hypothetical protein